MKQIIVLLSIIVFAVSSASGQQKEISSIWNPDEKQIDGLASDWVLPPLFKTEKISFSVSNNENYFYLLIQSPDQTVQQKIMRSGMTVNISSKEGKKKKVQLMFPLKSNALDNKERLTPDPEGNVKLVDQRAMMRQKFIERCTEMRIRGIKAVKGQIPINNEYDILVAINWEGENLLTYELQIPIDELVSEAPLTDLASYELDIKIQVHSIPQPERSSTDVSSGGGRGGRGGGGGRSGGSMRGGGSRPAGTQQGGAGTAMFTPDIFKSKITLAGSEK